MMEEKNITAVQQIEPELMLSADADKLARVFDNYLELGNPVICIMGPGDFTTAGHFIVLTGIKDGKFVVNDPNSRENSERLWSYEEISGQIKNLWACRLPE